MSQYDPAAFFARHSTLYRLSIATTSLSLLNAIRRAVRAPTRARRLANGLLVAVMAFEVIGLLRLKTRGTEEAAA